MIDPEKRTIYPPKVNSQEHSTNHAPAVDALVKHAQIISTFELEYSAQRETEMSEDKPKGSGYFSLAVGVLFIIILVASFLVDVRAIPAEWLLRCWLLFASGILLVWGSRRIKNGRNDWTVGQSTLNFVVGIVAATAAIFALVTQPALPTSQPSSPISASIVTQPQR